MRFMVLTVLERQAYNKLTVGETDRNKVMKDFDKARLIFLNDSIFVISVGFAIFWAFGTLKDVRGYGWKHPWSHVFPFVRTLRGEFGARRRWWRG